MLNATYILVVLGWFLGLVPIAAPPVGPGADQDARELVTREAVCSWSQEPPKLDGKLDDPCWKRATPIERFASFWDKTPRAGTKAYLVWDDKAIYYAANMTDTELRSFGTQRNDSLWDGDVFELFFKPSTDKAPYCEFQANPRGLVFEMAFARRGQFPASPQKAPVLGNQAVTVVDGTLDHPGDRDRGWTVEGRIPWTAFAVAGGRPKPGDRWRFAMCRYDYGPEGTKPVLMSSAPLTRPNFHQYEDYGTLRFEGPEAEQRTRQP